MMKRTGIQIKLRARGSSLAQPSASWRDDAEESEGNGHSTTVLDSPGKNEIGPSSLSSLKRAGTDASTTRGQVNKGRLVSLLDDGDEEDADLLQYEHQKRQRISHLIQQTFGDQGSTEDRVPYRVFDDDHDVSGKTRRGVDLLESNIFLNNLPPSITQDEICEAFLPFGDIASIKIFVPARNPESARSYTGFVAFMRKEDAVEAFYAMDGYEGFKGGQPIHLHWAQGIEVPKVPYAVRTLASSALAKTKGDEKVKVEVPASEATQRQVHDLLNRILSDIFIDPVISSAASYSGVATKLLNFLADDHADHWDASWNMDSMNDHRIHAIRQDVAEYLNETNPAHSYFVWKLYSLTEGRGSWDNWDSKPVFIQNRRYLPPPYTFVNDLGDHLDDNDEDHDQATSEEEDDESDDEGRQSHHHHHSGSVYTSLLLKTRQVQRLQRGLRKLDTSRSSIFTMMVYCVDLGKYASQVVSHIIASILCEGSSATQKLARFMLLHDILMNVSGGGGIPHASTFRSCIEDRLDEVLVHLGTFASTRISTVGRLSAEAFRLPIQRAMTCWEGRGLASSDKASNPWQSDGRPDSRDPLERGKRALLGV